MKDYILEQRVGSVKECRKNGRNTPRNAVSYKTTRWLENSVYKNVKDQYAYLFPKKTLK